MKSEKKAVLALFNEKNSDEPVSLHIVDRHIMKPFPELIENGALLTIVNLLINDNMLTHIEGMKYQITPKGVASLLQE